MNLNPFIFYYKKYPNCKLATIVNHFLSTMQRIFLAFATLITLLVVFGEINNWGEALCCASLMYFLWLVLKLKKDKWSDKIAAKQEAIDNLKDRE